MPSASATFTVGSPSAAQQQVSPSINPMVNTNASLNYPTYVPVTVPAPVPSKEAAITNVSIPQQVLPGSSFSIIVSITTYVAGTVNYTVTLQIPQLSLNQTSIPMTLSNMAVGTTTFNVSLPVTARALTASGVVTGQLTLQDTTNNQTVDGVPISFNIGGTSIPTSIGVVPSPIQPVPLGPVGRPVIGSTYTGPGAIPVRSYQGSGDFEYVGWMGSPDGKDHCYLNGKEVNCSTLAYQGYVFGQGSGQQRHQWDYMPHSVGGRYRAYQGTLGVDYTLACSDQSTANAAGQCANGTRAVVSPISQAPPPVVAAPVPAVVPTSTDTGIPVVQAPAPTVAPTPTPVPVVTPTPVPMPPTPAPVITPTVTPAVITNVPTHDWQDHTRREYPHWRQDQGRGYERERGRGWAWDDRRRDGRRAYQAQVTPQQLQPQPQAGSQLQPTTQGGAGGAVILTSMLPDGTLHLDAHGFQPMEQIQLDLNIPMSRVTKTTVLMADASGHLAHDYRLSKPPGKQYIAALRATGKGSNRVGFRTINV